VKVLVTGAAGFVGTKLLRALRKAGEEVVGLDKKTISPESAANCGSAIVCDIRDDARMAELPEELFGIDACVHLAAIAAPRQAEADPQLAWETNVRGTHNVLALCRKVGVKKIVFASSAHVYGISPKYMPTDENHPLALLDTYTTTKIIGEQLCDLFHRNYGISYTACRLFNAYGPGQSMDYFIGAKIRQAATGSGPVTIMNGAVTKDWVSVFDVARALVAAVRSPYVGPLNIGTGVETSLLEIAKAIASAFGKEVVPDGAQDGGPTRMCANWARANAVLGWSPETTFIEGIAEVIKATQEQPW
jgi:UDP-glucose 4-epimerase